MEESSPGVAPDVIERPDTAVMFVRAADEPEAIRRAWERLEAPLELHGRKFFGAFDARQSEYWACAQTREGDDPAALGFEKGVLPGGRFLRVRLRGEPPDLYGLIAPTFAALARSPDVDETRPGIEFYRRRDEIDLLLPVL